MTVDDLSVKTTLHLESNTVTLEVQDTTDYVGLGIDKATAKGILNISTPSGTVIYENEDYNNPDYINSSRDKTGIVVPVDEYNMPIEGTYYVKLKVLVNTTEYTKTFSYLYQYNRVIPSLQVTVNGYDSTLTCLDNTSYSDALSYSRVMSITPPNGSSLSVITTTTNTLGYPADIWSGNYTVAYSVNAQYLINGLYVNDLIIATLIKTAYKLDISEFRNYVNDYWSIYWNAIDFNSTEAVKKEKWLTAISAYVDSYNWAVEFLDYQRAYDCLVAIALIINDDITVTTSEEIIPFSPSTVIPTPIIDGSWTRLNGIIHPTIAGDKVVIGATSMLGSELLRVAGLLDAQNINTQSVSLYSIYQKLFAEDANTVDIQTDATTKFKFSSLGIKTDLSGGALIRRVVASGTSPIYSFDDDTDSGLGRYAAGQPSLIADGHETVRVLSSGINLYGSLNYDAATNILEDGSGSLVFTDKNGSVKLSDILNSNHAPVTLAATPNGLTLTGQVLGLGLSGTNTTGALSYSDWNNFNSKQAGSTLLTNFAALLSVNANDVIIGATSNSFSKLPIGSALQILRVNSAGTGYEFANVLSVAGLDKQIQYNSGGSSFGSDADFTYDSSAKQLSVENVYLTGTVYYGSSAIKVYHSGGDLMFVDGTTTTPVTLTQLAAQTVNYWTAITNGIYYGTGTNVLGINTSTITSGYALEVVGNIKSGSFRSDKFLYDSNGNILIGTNITPSGSDKFYLSNYATSAPLLYGEFVNKLLRLNGDLYLSGDINFDDSNTQVYKDVNSNLGFKDKNTSLLLKNLLTTETDPVYAAWYAQFSGGITPGMVSNWNTAYGLSEHIVTTGTGTKYLNDTGNYTDPSAITSTQTFTVNANGGTGSIQFTGIRSEYLHVMVVSASGLLSYAEYDLIVTNNGATNYTDNIVVLGGDGSFAQNVVKTATYNSNITTLTFTNNNTQNITVYYNIISTIKSA